jgi:hypothetical protein
MQIVDVRQKWLADIIDKTANDQPLTREEQQHIVAHALNIRMRLRAITMDSAMNVSGNSAMLDNPNPPSVDIVKKQERVGGE